MMNPPGVRSRTLPRAGPRSGMGVPPGPRPRRSEALRKRRGKGSGGSIPIPIPTPMAPRRPIGLRHEGGSSLRRGHSRRGAEALRKRFRNLCVSAPQRENLQEENLRPFIPLLFLRFLRLKKTPFALRPDSPLDPPPTLLVKTSYGLFRTNGENSIRERVWHFAK